MVRIDVLDVPGTAQVLAAQLLDELMLQGQRFGHCRQEVAAVGAQDGVGRHDYAQYMADAGLAAAPAPGGRPHSPSNGAAR